MLIDALYLHPLKSGAPLPARELSIGQRGPEGDRRWLVVDESGRFVTARQHPRLVTVRAELLAGGLRLSAPTLAPLDVPLPGATAARMQVTVWGDSVDARVASEDAAEWLTRHLGFAVRLVHMDAAAHRAVDPAFGQPGDEVTFADAYPVLVITRAALDDLNARLARPVPITRFRPNLVVAGGTAHAEDGWRRVRIGEVEFDAVKPCTRCVLTTVDPDTAQRDPDGEPLRTLTTYRRAPAGGVVSGVTFGMNLIPRGTGRLRLGDRVDVIA